MNVPDWFWNDYRNLEAPILDKHSFNRAKWALTTLGLNVDRMAYSVTQRRTTEGVIYEPEWHHDTVYNRPCWGIIAVNKEPTLTKQRILEPNVLTILEPGELHTRPKHVTVGRKFFRIAFLEKETL